MVGSFSSLCRFHLGSHLLSHVRRGQCTGWGNFDVICLSVNASYLSICISQSLLGVRDIFLKKKLQWGQACIFRQVGIEIGRIKVISSSPYDLVKRNSYFHCSNLCEVSGWSYYFPLWDTADRESAFSCCTGLGTHGEAYYFIQEDFKEVAGYSGNILPLPKPGFIFRRMAECNENGSLFILETMYFWIFVCIYVLNPIFPQWDLLYFSSSYIAL